MSEQDKNNIPKAEPVTFYPPSTTPDPARRKPKLPDGFKPLHFTWLPTRSCALACPSCRIPKKAKYDLPQAQTYEIMDLVKKKFPSVTFWCVLGGDVLDLADPVEFVRQLSQRDQFYAITSHSRFTDPNMPERLLRAGLTNWSVSIDNPSVEKTINGFKAIDSFQMLGVKDIHATLTIDKTNTQYIPDLVAKLTEKKVWSEVTPFIWQKNGQYDFGTSIKWRAPEQAFMSVVDQVVTGKNDGSRMVHNISPYFDFLKSDFNQNWKCDYPWGLVLDNDGHYRMCLHVRGTNISKHSIFDDVPEEQLLEDWNKDFEQHCNGCAWNCQYESSYVYNQRGSLKDVEDYFKHGGLPDVTKSA